MGRIYRIPFSGAVTAQVDIFEIVAASTKTVELLEFMLTQSTELGDAAEEQLLLHLKTGMTVSGSGGSAPTPIPSHLGSAAFAGTAEVLNTTKSGTGTIVTHESYSWNIRVPFPRIYTPETTIWLAPSARMALELATTPADSVSVAGYAIIREVG